MSTADLVQILGSLYFSGLAVVASQDYDHIGTCIRFSEYKVFQLESTPSMTGLFYHLRLNLSLGQQIGSLNYITDTSSGEFHTHD
jgi:hypothetical protein